MIYGSLQVSGFIYYLFFISYCGKEEFICTEKHVSSCACDTLIVLFFTGFIVHLIKLFNNLKNVIFLVVCQKNIKH